MLLVASELAFVLGPGFLPVPLVRGNDLDALLPKRYAERAEVVDQPTDRRLESSSSLFFALQDTVASETFSAAASLILARPPCLPAPAAEPTGRLGVELGVDAGEGT